VSGNKTLVEGDRVVWDRGPEYGRGRGPGEVVELDVLNLVTYARVRFDDPGLDDELVRVNELTSLEGRHA